MIVIGLDGATWSVIKPNLDSLPAFGKLLDGYMHSTLVCDVRPVHSAPSWSTIFSGKPPSEHGIMHFVMGEAARKELLAKRMFVWDRARRPIVMGVPISLPPINVNCDIKGWESVVLSTTAKEMKDSTEMLCRETMNAIRFGDADLVAVVFSETDRAQHMFWHKPELVLEHYKSIDSALKRLMPHLEGRDFLILSDHGFTDAQTTRKNGWDTVRENQSGGHHPDGIAISNRKPPEKVTDVCGFIASGMK